MMWRVAFGEPMPLLYMQTWVHEYWGIPTPFEKPMPEEEFQLTFNSPLSWLKSEMKKPAAAHDTSP
jgi:hypothetical protein